MAAAWRFYVYEIIEGDSCLYIGKGSGFRLKNQIRKFSKEGREIARFKREADALSFERKLIKERQPPLNKTKGGDGARATKKIYRRQPWEIEIDRVGSQVYCARILMGYVHYLPHYGVSSSEIEKIRRVAYG